MKTPTLLLTTALLLTFACADVDDPAAEARMTANLVDEVANLTNGRADLLCACADSYGFTDHQDCRDYFTYVEPEERDCLKDVVAIDHAGARDYLECATAVGEELVACLEPWTCGDGELADECHEEYRSEMAECPELPIGMIGEIRDCMG